MRKLKRFLAREDGIALATVVFMVAILTALSVTLIDQVNSESNRAGASVSSDAVYQAAEAGISDYIAKLLDDPQYYDHYVANGEATRTSCTTYSSGVCTAFGSLVVSHGNTWTAGTHWGYNAGVPNHKDTWYVGTGNAFGNSTRLCSGTPSTCYAYDLMITPTSPSLGTNYVTILSTGCKLVSGGTTCNTSAPTGVPQRSIEVRVRRTTPADFQFMLNGTNSTCFGSTTYGVVYSTGNICHNGTAYGNLEAEGNVTGSVTYLNGATYYNGSPTPASHYIRNVVKNAIQFSSFNVSLADIRRAAGLNSPTTDFEDTNASAWRIVFSSDGTVKVWKCTNSSTPEKTQPTCATTTSYSGPIPSNGAIYTGQDAIISWPSSPGPNSVVNGRVSVASATDIILAGNISYASETSGPDDDVLGLIAQNNIWIAKYAPNILKWRAATIALTGIWSDYDCTNDAGWRGNNSSMTFIGTSAIYDGSGCMEDYNGPNGFNIDNVTRIADDGSAPGYSNYDALKFLFPPWFPTIDGVETTVLFQEVPPNTVPLVG
jgi:hypothetical protein